MSEKLAAALLQITRVNERGEAIPLVDREWAKGKTAKQIIGLFEFDHFPVARELGGSNHPTNLVPRIYREHREKTNTFDIPTIARTKRLSREQEEFRRRLLAKAGQAEVPEPERKKGRSRWPKQKLRSRSTFRGAST